MDRLRIKAIQEFKEEDIDQGVERTYLYYKTGSYHIETKKQNIDLLETPRWGKMLFLDGCLQSTTMDEVIYHNALVHPLMNTLTFKNNILILGGGEGATAREVLRWPIKHLRMVDYDRELVEFMALNANEWARDSFDDSRLRVTYSDAWEFMKTAEKYDGIVIDLTDPDLKKERWGSLLESAMKSVIGSKGGLVMNAGLYLPWDTENLNNIVALVRGLCLLNRVFKYYIYTAFIPSFNAEWTYIVISHKSKFMIEPEFTETIPPWIRRSIRTLPDSLLEPANTLPILTKV